MKKFSAAKGNETVCLGSFDQFPKLNFKNFALVEKILS